MELCLVNVATSMYMYIVKVPMLKYITVQNVIGLAMLIEGWKKWLTNSWNGCLKSCLIKGLILSVILIGSVAVNASPTSGTESFKKLNEKINHLEKLLDTCDNTNEKVLAMNRQKDISILQKDKEIAVLKEKQSSLGKDIPKIGFWGAIFFGLGYWLGAQK